MRATLSWWLLPAAAWLALSCAPALQYILPPNEAGTLNNMNWTILREPPAAASSAPAPEQAAPEAEGNSTPPDTSPPPGEDHHDWPTD
ncbi:MAG TPA: hypothetical protein VJN18_07995 [Polyangiaceae bacterium]|nr:hypothetical protein [Polyangiaceae bacterium]